MLSPISVQAVILQVLAAEASYGAAILGRLRACSGGNVSVAEGAVYEHLRAMEAGGLARRVSVPWTKKPGRPPLVYALTEDGLRLAREHRRFLLRLLVTECGDWE